MDEFFTGGSGTPPPRKTPAESGGRQYRITYTDGKVDIVNAPNQNDARLQGIPGKAIDKVEVFTKGNYQNIWSIPGK